MSLELVERELSDRMSDLSHSLVNDVFKDSSEIKTIDLRRVQIELGMDPKNEDIYIINKEGIVINTTFAKDKGLNLFAFGDVTKNHLLNVFANNKFVNEKFTSEDKTKRVKKYTYQPTLDGEFIIELGCYSEKADDVISTVKDKIKDISKIEKSVVNVELWIISDNIFSLNENSILSEDDKQFILNCYEQNQPQNIEVKDENNQIICSDFISVNIDKSDLYKGAVVEITTNRTAERRGIRREFIKILLILSVTLSIVVWLVYKKTKVITDPIQKLVKKVVRISGGHLNERAMVEGNNEITKLSEQFNNMISQLEEYYNDLEKKVVERTAEILAQKEEIEKQRDNIEKQKDQLTKSNSQLTFAYNEIDEQKKHIMDSIHYAKRIQNAILPPDSYFKKLLPDAFVLYKPKDIVSGDFYWVAHIDHYVIVAAVDCTGHGVPGAFMSIVGSNHLNTAINVHQSKNAAEILNILNEGVTQTLRESEEMQGVKDGMDLSLCVIDTKNNKLQYAGAYNPLFIVRDEELMVYKADKFAIGASSLRDGKLCKFTNNEIDLLENDVVYMLSDGYQDQFGGPRGKKFMIKRLKELFVDIHKTPMWQQKDILDDRLIAWSGDEEQVDDILVLGIRI